MREPAGLRVQEPQMSERALFPPPACPLCDRPGTAANPLVPIDLPHPDIVVFDGHKGCGIDMAYEMAASR